MTNDISERKIPVVPKGMYGVFAMLVSCFALWGLLNNMTDHLVPAFKTIFNLPDSTAVYVQVSFYGSYSAIAVFASILIQKAGYRAGLLWGLGVYIIGALMYIPACITQSFWLYIAGIFVVAGGCAVLETTCNPYVLAIGDEATAVRRLNFAQMFNPVGSIAGIILAQQLILANLNPATIEERAMMSPEVLKSIVNKELFWVCVPYVGLCAIAALIWIFFFRSKSTAAQEENESAAFGTIFGILVKSPKWYLGVVAQVFYVGVQIAAWTYINLYGQYEFGITKAKAANYYVISISVFIVCRWIATFLMKYVDPAKLMAWFAAAAIGFTAGVMYIPGNVLFTIGGLPFSWNIICLILMSGCMSLMFPTIYGIALGGIDKRAHKIGAAGLIMAIVGGAILTKWMANVISSQLVIDGGNIVKGIVKDGSWFLKLVPASSEVNWELNTSAAALRGSFAIPAICFAVVLVYSILFRTKKK
ncbi:MAG: L-fucose:H+ symporter permease [Kiritimatiellae bacterium]|nr:L-fucose:H+ symporter permease [Kiritimatiellia bacterium]